QAIHVSLPESGCFYSPRAGSRRSAQPPGWNLGLVERVGDRGDFHRVAQLSDAGPLLQAPRLVEGKANAGTWRTCPVDDGSRLSGVESGAVDHRRLGPAISLVEYSPATWGGGWHCALRARVGAGYLGEFGQPLLFSRGAAASRSGAAGDPDGAVC